MSELHIRNDYEISLWEKKLKFRDDKPVVVGYCRVSTDDQADEGHSLEVQASKIREACDRKFGKSDFHLVYIYDEKSGKLPFNRGGMNRSEYREGLTLAVSIFQRGLAHYLAVYKMNRITRNLRIYLELDEDVLQPNSIEIFSAMEPIGNRTAASRFFTSIIGAASENERDNIAAVSRHGIEQRLNQRYYFGQVPFGWKWQDAQTDRNGCRPKNSHHPRQNIEPVTDESEWVKRVFDHFLAGKSLASIAQELEKAQVKTRKGANKWSPQEIWRMLRKPVHAGLVELDGKLVEGAHFSMRIVELSVFYAVRDRMMRSTRSRCFASWSANHIFGGLARCGICGKKMIMTPRKKGSRYECYGIRGSMPHAGFSCLVKSAEGRIVEAIGELAADQSLLRMASTKLTGIINNETDHIEKQRQTLADQLANYEQQLTRWCALFAEGKMESDTFTDYERIIKENIASHTTRIRELENIGTQHQCRAVIFERALEMLRQFPSVWKSMDMDEKRTLASYIIDELSMERDGIWVNIRVKFILGREAFLRVPIRGRGARGEGLESLSRAHLTLANYYLHGWNDHQIAEDKDVSIRTIRMQKSELIKSTGTTSLEEALDAVAYLVNERQEELTFGRRLENPAKRRFTQRQVATLKLLAQHLTVREIAERMGCSVSGLHVDRLYEKLGSQNRKQALVAARKLHLIDYVTVDSDRPTSKQLDVLNELVRGATQPMAAQSLSITLSAVKERMRCMFRRYGVGCEDDLLALARERRWIE